MSELSLPAIAGSGPSSLKRLTAQHATRDEELDELLRREVFCDLFTVVRQALRISYDNYSISALIGRQNSRFSSQATTSPR